MNHGTASETLLQALGAIAHRQFVAFLVIWLTVGMPITCQQHGSMSLLDTDAHHAGNHNVPESGCTLGQHQTSATSILNLMGIGILPHRVAPIFHLEVTRLAFHIPLLPSEWTTPPPTPPPRLV
jgi:hypothetical protein